MARANGATFEEKEQGDRTAYDRAVQQAKERAAKKRGVELKTGETKASVGGVFSIETI